jgi:hypothetical protein
MLFLLLELTLRTKLLKQRICSTLGHIIEFDVNNVIFLEPVCKCSFWISFFNSIFFCSVLLLSKEKLSDYLECTLLNL